MGYKNNFERAAQTAGDALCYLFDIPPGIYAQDTCYSFHNPGEPASTYSLIDTGKTNQTVAFILQDYITGFARHGVM